MQRNLTKLLDFSKWLGVSLSEGTRRRDSLLCNRLEKNSRTRSWSTLPASLNIPSVTVNGFVSQSSMQGMINEFFDPEHSCEFLRILREYPSWSVFPGKLQLIAHDTRLFTGQLFAGSDHPSLDSAILNLVRRLKRIELLRKNYCSLGLKMFADTILILFISVATALLSEGMWSFYPQN